MKKCWMLLLFQGLWEVIFVRHWFMIKRFFKRSWSRILQEIMCVNLLSRYGLLNLLKLLHLNILSLVWQLCFMCSNLLYFVIFDVVANVILVFRCDMCCVCILEIWYGRLCVRTCVTYFMLHGSATRYVGCSFLWVSYFWLVLVVSPLIVWWLFSILCLFWGKYGEKGTLVCTLLFQDHV